MKKIFGLLAVLCLVGSAMSAGSVGLDKSVADDTLLTSGAYELKIEKESTGATSVTGTTGAHIATRLPLAAGWRHMLITCDSVGAQADSVTFTARPYYGTSTDTMNFTYTLGVAGQAGSKTYTIMRIPQMYMGAFYIDVTMTRTAATNVTKNRSWKLIAYRKVDWNSSR